MKRERGDDLTILMASTTLTSPPSSSHSFKSSKGDGFKDDSFKSASSDDSFKADDGLAERAPDMVMMRDTPMAPVRSHNRSVLAMAGPMQTSQSAGPSQPPPRVESSPMWSNAGRTPAGHTPRDGLQSPSMRFELHASTPGPAPASRFAQVSGSQKSRFLAGLGGLASMSKLGGGSSHMSSGLGSRSPASSSMQD